MLSLARPRCRFQSGVKPTAGFGEWWFVEHCETLVSAPDVGFSLMEGLESLRVGAGCSTAKAFVLKTMAFVFTAEGSVFTAEGVSFTAAGSVFRTEGSALTAECISVRKWPFLCGKWPFP